MLVVTAKIVIKEGKGAEFVQSAQGCIVETRKEKGNMSYVLLADTEDSCRYTVLEEWESKAALDEHMKTTHFIELGNVLDALATEPLAIKVYEANVI